LRALTPFVAAFAILVLIVLALPLLGLFRLILKHPSRFAGRLARRLPVSGCATRGLRIRVLGGRGMVVRGHEEGFAHLDHLGVDLHDGDVCGGQVPVAVLGQGSAAQSDRKDRTGIGLEQQEAHHRRFCRNKPPLVS
jgi:hypothetical protein